MTSIITKPKINISPELLAKIETQIHEAGQVIVHCIISNVAAQGMYMRIWPTTNIYDQSSDHSSELITAENICYYPYWQEMNIGDNFFTLVFAGLPRSCAIFDLIEHCNGNMGAFRIMNISRNETDVYYVNF